MATITSTQSGNFNSTSTWAGGVVPVDGDSFIVDYGHIVTVDDDRRVTNGYNDSYARGKLHITGTGKLRMNGILYVDNTNNYTQHFAEGQNSGGFFRMDDGSLLEIRGSNADQHRLHVRPNGYVTCEIEGSNPNPQTALSADIDNRDTIIPVVDASDFRAGDWITIYKAERTGKSWQYYKSDEAVWIHDIDNNNIYFRYFVGPESTIISSTNDSIMVSDASVFRKNYKIIFGTGANRNVLTISEINYATNTITCSSSIVGSVVGEKVYQTGLEKGHLSGDDVLRISAVLTEDSDAGSSTIKVNNTNGFSVGDLILLPANDTEYSGNSTWDYVMDYTIDSIDTNTNTITITGGYTNPNQTTLQKNHKAGVGGLVVNMTRSTKIKAPAGTVYGDDQASFLWIEYFNNSGNYRRKVKLKNFELNIGSNTASINYRCISWRGHNSYDLVSYGNYTCEFDGVVIYPSKRNTDNTGYLWDLHQINTRNCISYNSSGRGIYTYGSNRGLYNNICARNSSESLRNGGVYEPRTEMCYNYLIRSGSYNLFFDNAPEAKTLTDFNYLLFTPGRPFGVNYPCGLFTMRRNYIDCFVVWPTSERGSRTIFFDSYLGNTWDITGEAKAYLDSINLQDGGYYSLERTNAHTAMFSSICNNFKYNGLLEFNRTALRFWDESNSSWRVYPDRDEPDWCGFDNHVFIPANTTVYVVGSIKTVSGNTNYPFIRVSDSKNYYNGLYSNNTEAALDPSDSLVTMTTGFVKTERFTSNSVNDFETKTITIDPLPFDTYMNISISCNGSGGNSRLGWNEKDLKIILSNPLPIVGSVQMLHALTTKLPIITQSTPSQLKTILGG